MIFFFAGSLRPQYRPHIPNRLESFYDCQNEKPDSIWPRYLLDSGGFTARTNGTFICVEKYAKFLHKFEVPVAFNLDTMDVEETLANQKYLQANAPKTYVIPIYHASDYFSPKYRELIDDYCQQYKFIALGGYAGVSATKEQFNNFFKHVFRRTTDKIKVHGLGMTGKQLVRKFPFFCVDSTSWLAPGRYGNGVAIKTNKHMKFYSKSYHYTHKIVDEIQETLRMQQETTSLWSQRGVTWKDDIWYADETCN